MGILNVVTITINTWLVITNVTHGTIIMCWFHFIGGSLTAGDKWHFENVYLLCSNTPITTSGDSAGDVQYLFAAR